jgi:hypothetical protein
MGNITNRHGDWPETVELVTHVLAFDPGKESLLGPGFLKGDVHGRFYRMAWPEFLHLLIG